MPCRSLVLNYVSVLGKPMSAREADTSGQDRARLERSGNAAPWGVCWGKRLAKALSSSRTVGARRSRCSVRRAPPTWTRCASTKRTLANAERGKKELVRFSFLARRRCSRGLQPCFFCVCSVRVCIDVFFYSRVPHRRFALKVRSRWCLLPQFLCHAVPTCYVGWVTFVPKLILIHIG